MKKKSQKKKLLKKKRSNNLTTNKVKAAYTAKDIEVLEGLEPVRKRPGTVSYTHLTLPTKA